MKHFVSLFRLFCASSFKPNNPSAASRVSGTPQQTEPNKSSGGVGGRGGELSSQLAAGSRLTGS